MVGPEDPPLTPMLLVRAVPFSVLRAPVSATGMSHCNGLSFLALYTKFHFSCGLVLDGGVGLAWGAGAARSPPPLWISTYLHVTPLQYAQKEAQ